MTAPYRAVKDEIVRRVRAREWPPGAQIPPETQLAADFGCARATVNRALRELAEDGLLDRRRKAGTRVAAEPVRRLRFDIPVIRAEVEATGAPYRYARLSRAEGPAPAWLSAALALPDGAPVLHVAAVHYAGPAPFAHEDRWIVLATVPSAAEEPFDRVGPNEWLVARLPFSEAEMVFLAVAAGAPEAATLGVPEGAPVFRAERTTWLDGRPVTRARLTYPPGYRMVSRL